MTRLLKFSLFIGTIGIIVYFFVARFDWGALATANESAGGEYALYMPLAYGGATQFVETNDGDPVVPTPWNPDSWDVAVHSRDLSTWYQLEPMDAMHGPDCGAPPTTHLITNYEDAVYNCKNHMMTAIKAGGYGAIYLTPNEMVDFSAREAVIRWDMSTMRTSGRDWMDIWITPYSKNLVSPAIDWLPDLNGEPRYGIQIEMALAQSGTGSGEFKAYLINEYDRIPIDLVGDSPNYEDVLVPDARRRDTFEIRIREGHLTFWMPDYGYYFINKSLPPLGFDKAVVQFSHHSYNPTKACQNDGSCGPNTFHWDNFFIEPTRPFTIIPAEQRYTEPDTGATLTFGEPAPEGARLRFAGIGENLQVSFDNGATWQGITIQQQESYREGHFRTYWHPIPAGIQSVKIRGNNWWGGEWHVRDASIWSKQVVAQSGSSSEEATKLLIKERFADVVRDDPRTCAIIGREESG